MNSGYYRLRKWFAASALGFVIMFYFLAALSPERQKEGYAVGVGSTIGLGRWYTLSIIISISILLLASIRMRNGGGSRVTYLLIIPLLTLFGGVYELFFVAHGLIAMNLVEVAWQCARIMAASLVMLIVLAVLIGTYIGIRLSEASLSA